MPGPGLQNDQLRVTLPLKSSPSNKQLRIRSDQQDDPNASQQPRKWQTIKPAPSKQSMLALKRRAHHHYKRQAQMRTNPLRINSFQSPAVDPFTTWPIAVTPIVPRMAQYFIQNWAPEHGHAFAIEGHPNPYLSLLWPFALHDAMYFEALISVCLATWLPSQGIACKQDRMFLHHRSNVVSRLRERLQSPDRCCDNATILTVASLGTIDYVTGDHESATSHVDGMRQMVDMRGGIGNLDPLDKLVKINIAAYESLWSFVTESRTPSDEYPQSQPILPIGQLPKYMTHPFKPEMCTLLAKLPPRFCELGLQGAFSQQMIMILSAVNEVLLFATGSETPSALTPGSSPSAASSISLVQPSSLVDLLGDVRRLSSLHTTLTEHLLCHGLMAYIYLLRHLYFHDSLGPFYTSALEILTNKCIRHSPDIDDVDRGCYFWVSVVIGTALMNITCPPDNRFTVFDHLISRYTECQNYNWLVSMVNGFFWSPDLDATAHRSWEQAMARRAVPVPVHVPVHQSFGGAGHDRLPQPLHGLGDTREPSRPSRMRIRDVIL